MVWLRVDLHHQNGFEAFGGRPKADNVGVDASVKGQHSCVNTIVRDIVS